jgi:ABC-2 type transport system permease protein
VIFGLFQPSCYLLLFAPLTLAPAWIQNAAAINPFSYAVDAARALFNGDFGDATVVYGFGIIAVLSLLALWWAARSFRRATA